MGLVSGLADPVEDVKSRKPDLGVLGSRVGEPLLECTVMTPDKRAHRLTVDR